jgi:cyclopropane fatty-acyl-phospholipid synthase-like methyltransferase
MKTCPACDSEDIQLFMTGIFDSATTKVMECAQCGTQFLDPLMTEEEEAEYYEGYYRKQQIRHFKPMGLADLQQRAYEHYDQYRSIYLELITGCESILEIGSGTGGFLKFVRQYSPNARVIAIERCSENVDFIRQCFNGKIEVLDSLDDVHGIKFDCIGAFGVFEHLRNSRDFLVSLRECLSDQGRLALNVPNKMHALVYAFDLEEFKKFTYMKQHYFTYTERGFDLLAGQTGLRVEKFNYMQVWGLANHLSWLRHKKPRDFSDITKFLSLRTIESYNNDLIQRKMSDLMMVVLRAQG